MKEAEYDQLEQNQKTLNEDYIRSLNEIEIMKTTNMELLQIQKDLEESIVNAIKILFLFNHFN